MAADVDSDAPAAGGGRFAFVGREREGRLLSGALEDPPAVVVVEGEAGVGKTRLVREVTTGPRGRRSRVVTGFCHPLREPFPYGPVIDALRQTVPWMPPAVKMPPEAALWRRFFRNWPTACRRLLPSNSRPQQCVTT